MHGHKEFIWTHKRLFLCLYFRIFSMNDFFLANNESVSHEFIDQKIQILQIKVKDLDHFAKHANELKENLESLNPKSKIHLDMDLLPENPMKLKVNGNVQLLHLAFSNIISNGCKYSNFETVTVSIGASDDFVYIVIKDNGIGIPENEIKYIYDPFFRATNTKNFEGYGIGLPLTRNIIRMHKGTLLVTSIENKGTTVQITLPVWQPDAI